LKHRELRKAGLFQRPWLIEGSTGQYRDLLDGRPFSTQFSHTRFLIPELMKYNGTALFMDCDMIFLSDIKKLFNSMDQSKAVMCVKHNHVVQGQIQKMDDRPQLNYFRKNWSSFVMWNCSHPRNKQLTREKVNYMRGAELHAFVWLKEDDIGSIPYTYNFISGVSPQIYTDEAKLISSKVPFDGAKQEKIDVIHYTEGGPWFDNCRHVPYADLWDEEYRMWVEAGSPTYDGIVVEQTS